MNSVDSNLLKLNIIALPHLLIRIIYKKDGYRQRNVRQYLHILASPWYACPWDIRGKCYTVKCCQTHRSMYPSIFNRFPVIQPVSSQILHLSTFLHILVSPGYVSGTIGVNVICLQYLSSSLVLQIF